MFVRTLRPRRFQQFQRGLLKSGLASSEDFFKIARVVSMILGSRKSLTLVIAAILASIVSGFAQSPTANPTLGETKSEVGVTPTPESTEDTEVLNDWSEISPNDALFAATRLVPDQVYIHRHDLDGVAISIFRAELQTRTLVARHDFRGRLISHIEWSPDSKFLLFTTASSGGHQPWHAPAFLFCASDNSFRDVESAIGTVVSPDFRFEPPDIAVMTVKKGDEADAEVKVPLAKAMHDMPLIKDAAVKEQTPKTDPRGLGLILAIAIVILALVTGWVARDKWFPRERKAKRLTAKKAIELAHDTKDHRDEIKDKFILIAKLTEIQKFMFGISAQPNNEYFNWARIALDVRIARSLSRLTVMLVVLTVVLVVFEPHIFNFLQQSFARCTRL
jgi:hypothetical protein